MYSTEHSTVECMLSAEAAPDTAMHPETLVLTYSALSLRSQVHIQDARIPRYGILPEQDL